MREVSHHTLNQDLQTILDRYSLVGEGADPAAIDITNFDRKYSETLNARKDRLYGELTSRGLVLVWSTPEKTDNCTADVLVIGRSVLEMTTHVYNRRQEICDWQADTGIYISVPLDVTADTLSVMPLDQAVSNRHTKRYQNLRANYERAAKTLAKFAAATSKYDALHQTVAERYPTVHENLAQLHPYAGHAYGPRVNLQAMIDGEVPFHFAVFEAMRDVPELSIDN